MPTWKLTLAYDGSGFVGWQRQAEGISIQGVVEAAAARIAGIPDVTATGAGRTDAGVHALGQVASVAIPWTGAPANLQRALNGVLPPAVRVLAVEAVDSSFHARYGARVKHYAYRVLNAPVASPFERGRAWHVTAPLDEARMREALALIVGTHDFSAFQGAGSSVATTVRTVREACLTAGPVPFPVGGATAPGTLFTFALRGDGFLRHMVRNIVGTVVEIGRGRWEPGQMADMLASRDRTQAGPTAPAEGLYLVKVEY
ncbi:MAG TPA: tRNA pseudouridine(38-40) synthase TruA [Vicinamibacterales bacterium]